MQAHRPLTVELLDGKARPKVDGFGSIEFVTAVGPRSYWPEEEARAYRMALEAFAHGGRPVDDVANAAKALVAAARRREEAWSQDEWLFRITAAIVGWIFWDNEPGTKRDV